MFFLLKFRVFSFLGLSPFHPTFAKNEQNDFESHKKEMYKEF